MTRGRGKPELPCHDRGRNRPVASLTECRVRRNARVARLRRRGTLAEDADPVSAAPPAGGSPRARVASAGTCPSAVRGMRSTHAMRWGCSYGSSASRQNASERLDRLIPSRHAGSRPGPLSGAATTTRFVAEPRMRQRNDREIDAACRQAAPCTAPSAAPPPPHAQRDHLAEHLHRLAGAAQHLHARRRHAPEVVGLEPAVALRDPRPARPPRSIPRSRSAATSRGRQALLVVGADLRVLRSTGSGPVQSRDQRVASDAVATCEHVSVRP